MCFRRREIVQTCSFKYQSLLAKTKNNSYLPFSIDAPAFSYPIWTNTITSNHTYLFFFLLLLLIF